MEVVLKYTHLIKVLDHWNAARIFFPFTVTSNEDSFTLEISMSNENVNDTDHQYLLIRSYLGDNPPPDILRILQRVDCISISQVFSFKGKHDGLSIFGDKYANYIKNKSLIIQELIVKFLQIIIWRMKIRGIPSSLYVSPTSLFWGELSRSVKCFDDIDFKQIPTGITEVGIPGKDELELTRENEIEISELLNSGGNMPLGHGLLREAWRIHESNQRSALVIAIAAVETQVKEFITHSAPETEWLIENFPSPPLHKIIKDYLPRLTSYSGEANLIPQIPKEWRSILHDAVEKRNKVVHGRFVNIDHEELILVLNTVFDFLYFLDYHSGEKWAK